MQYVLIGGFVIGFTQFVKSLWDKDYKSATIIAGAAAIGAIAGFFHIEGTDVATGIVVGLAAAGTVTLGQVIGGQSITKPE